MKTFALDVLRHRVAVSYEAEAENITSEDIIRKCWKRCPCRERPTRTFNAKETH